MQRPATSHSQKINEQIRRQLLPRTDKLKQMINLNLVPQSSADKVIIPCLQKTLGFKTNQYLANKQFLEDFIGRLDFNKFVRKCNKVIEEEVIKKTKKQNQSFFGIISTLLKVSIVIAILTFFLLATIVFVEFSESIISIVLMIAGILLASASMIAVVCPIVLYNSKYETVNYQEAIQNRLAALTKQQNEILLENGKKHLKWEVQHNFFWIELNIDQSLYQESLQQQRPVKIVEDEFSEEASAENFFKKKSEKSQLNKQELVHDA